MAKGKTKAYYERMLKKYPDVMSVPQMSKICNFCSKTGYKLVQDDKIESLRVGRNVFIPKEYLISYLMTRDGKTAR